MYRDSESLGFDKLCRLQILWTFSGGAVSSAASTHILRSFNKARRRINDKLLQGVVRNRHSHLKECLSVTGWYDNVAS